MSVKIVPVCDGCGTTDESLSVTTLPRDIRNALSSSRSKLELAGWKCGYKSALCPQCLVPEVFTFDPCPVCGVVIEPTTDGRAARRKKFCSEACKMKDYRTRKDAQESNPSPQPPPTPTGGAR